MRAIITVIGNDTVGILARVSGVCAKYEVNILEVTQSVLQEFFSMIMLVDITNATVPFNVLQESLGEIGKEIGLRIHVMHEDIFNSMHRI